MNKQDLIKLVAQETNQPESAVKVILENFFANTTKAIRTGRDLKIVGFATFTKIKRKARLGRNPRTGQVMKLPAVWTPKARFHEKVKAMVK